VERDSVDRIVEACAKSDPSVDASPLEVVGRLLLCVAHLERAIAAALQPLELSFGEALWATTRGWQRPLLDRAPCDEQTLLGPASPEYQPDRR
jgi:hypothetical protein